MISSQKVLIMASLDSFNNNTSIQMKYHVELLCFSKYYFLTMPHPDEI